MKFIDKMERKLGKYAIHNLMNYIIVLYVIGLILSYLTPGVYAEYFALEPAKILQGEVWRIFTFLLQSPNTNLFFFIFTLYLYYMLGSTLEKNWGAFRFNLYYFTGVIGTVLGAIIAYLITRNPSITMDTYYINMSLFLGFATLFPDMQLLLFFIIPVKMKWLAYFDAAFFIYTIIVGDIGTKIAAILALANFVLYFFGFMGNRGYSPKQMKRKAAYNRSVNNASRKVTRHKCVVCGRTELDGENLEFRFCSKCNGNYEYCQDHLFTHTHVK